MSKHAVYSRNMCTGGMLILTQYIVCGKGSSWLSHQDVIAKEDRLDTYWLSRQELEFYE